MAELRTVYPFTALVGQAQMRLALELNAVNPAIGGVLIRGEKGTAKSTAVRALARLLPELEVVVGCHFGCAPRGDATCSDCQARLAAGEELEVTRRQMRVVELPINASEDRVVGSIDLEAAIHSGQRRFEPGVLAEANRQILYVDEVNLLDDHIVDVLLDAAAMGVNVVEREGISVWHPSRFILVGTMNPEEGDLRPQLLDRFGLCVDVFGIGNIADRVEIVQRRERFEDDPEGFAAEWEEEEVKERDRIDRAIAALPKIQASRQVLEAIARLAIELEVDGHRADLVARKAAQAYSALEALPRVGMAEVAAVAPMVLAHRVRSRPGQRPHDIAGATRRVLGEA
ncbi:MAG TPA: AAA family ATPase [Candidatus Dormibacteraeota bacterium]|nr:AAA family ATPase [Candidatus Dormibacteraeota bacterium]